MSYYFRQQQMQQERERVEKRGLGAALDRIADKMAGIASRGWDEEAHPRGKTTPESNNGSFRPAGGGGAEIERAASGRKITQAVKDDLLEIQRVGYSKLHAQELRSHDAFNTWAQRRMKDLMGPGYEDLVNKMTAKIWNEFKLNREHRYFGPSDWSEVAWAVKHELRL